MAVHEYLRYLESAGFDGAPRVLGTDGDTEMLTYLRARELRWIDSVMPGLARALS